MTTAQQSQIDASRPAPRRRAKDRAGRWRTARRLAAIGLLAWVSVTAPLCAAEEKPGEPTKAAATATAPAVSDRDLMEAAWKLRQGQPKLFGDAAGVLVLESLPDSQAQAVGLRPGDILLRYAGQPLDGPDGLIAAAGQSQTDSPVALELLREGRPLRVALKAGRIGVRIAAVSEPPAPDPAAQSDRAGLYDQPVLALDPGMHTAMINRADTDRAGRLAATGSDDKTVRLWALDGDLSEPLATWRMPAGPGDVGKIDAVAMAPAGDLVAAGGWARWTEGDPQEQIYLLDRDGRLVQRIGGLPNTVLHLAFSPDGRWLAAGLGGREGIRIYDRESGWTETARDTDYGGAVYGLDFAPDGRLATTSLDGQVRLYDARLRRIARQGLGAGERPAHIAFRPDGDRLAVGFADKPAVLLLDGRTLAPLARQPDLAGIDNGNLGAVAWSRDGATLYAAGGYQADGRSPVLAWPDAGTGARRTRDPGPLNAVMSLKSLADGALLVAAGDPYLAVQGAGRTVRASPGFDPRGQRHNLAVSADGLQVDFGFEEWGSSDRHRFDLAALTDPARPALARLAAPDGRTGEPRQTGLPIADWVNNPRPTLADTPLPLEPYETARSLAIHPDGQRFILGTEWWLRAFDSAGKPLWRRAVPGAVWAVNIAGDGRLAVAAYADGTIRWQRMDDGRELLAFYPMTDKKNWVAWTPEGFYGATPGAHGVLKWHVNRGWDQLADAYPVSQFRYLRRPDALRLVLQEGETARALGLADMTRARQEVQRITKAAVPPGARLYLVGVGVGDYGENASQLRLKYAAKDVTDVASALLNTQSGLYAEVKPQVLTNVDATRAKLLAALDTVAEQMAKSPTGGDLAVFHFSGHGALLGPEGKEQYYLLPHEVDARTKQQIRNTAISIGELRSRLEELGRHGRVLALLDACHSGAATLADGALAVDGGALRGALAGLPNVTVLTSSSSAAPSVERDDWQNGAFTEVLLRALGKDADADQNGLISMTELTGFLSEQLPRLTVGAQPQQPGMEVRFQSEVFVSDL
ncbi:caspase family protein [uncultured Thiodictyon sp.]|jgi:WD40 repeat protein|uniref:caspase family protein n=1 Tax=uncultured Thiodictyon sp. TaxID=1846217 RepID=UPI0025E8620C|nr:caspase family protein [uncultured Thiodictyon sp.]